MRYDPKSLSEGEILRFAYLPLIWVKRGIMLVDAVPSKEPGWMWHVNTLYFETKEELLLYLESIGTSRVDFYEDEVDYVEFVITGRIVKMEPMFQNLKFRFKELERKELFR